jgi:hypothetical protein
MDGWIKLHRKIRNNPVFSDIHLLRLWIICLTEVTHKEREQIVGRQVVNLLPGQFVTGRFDLQGLYNRGLSSEQQKSPYTVWRWLTTLQDLDFLSIKSSNKFSVVTVVKWSEYQSCEQQNEQQTSNKRAANEQQVSTNKNVKNDKNEKKTPRGDGFTPEFEEFWSSYPRKVEQKAAFLAWNSAIKVDDPSVIILCAKNYAYTCKKEETAQKFIKHPTTFLNKQRYRDHMKQERTITEYRDPYRPVPDDEPLEGYG